VGEQRIDWSVGWFGLGSCSVIAPDRKDRLRYVKRPCLATRRLLRSWLPSLAAWSSYRPFRLAGAILLARSGRIRVEPLDHNPTRERAKDKRAHEQNRSGHTEPAQDVSYHVTNYQRR